MKAELDGRQILSERDFHDAIVEALPFPSHYGRNLDALWDVVSRDIPRPVMLTWTYAAISRAAFPERFALILEVLRDAEREDASLPQPDKFVLEIVESANGFAPSVQV